MGLAEISKKTGGDQNAISLNTTHTAYLATLAAGQAKDELLSYPVKAYQDGQASISELVRKTGLDVTAIMVAIAAVLVVHTGDARCRGCD